MPKNWSQIRKSFSLLAQLQQSGLSLVSISELQHEGVQVFYVFFAHGASSRLVSVLYGVKPKVCHWYTLLLLYSSLLFSISRRGSGDDDSSGSGSGSRSGRSGQQRFDSTPVSLILDLKVN